MQRETRRIEPGTVSRYDARMRIAITTRDGISVNERFHRAVDDSVWELAEGGSLRFVERRPRPSVVGGAFRDFEHYAKNLADCRWVASLGFTREARRELSGRGFALLELRGAIETEVRDALTRTRGQDVPEEKTP